MQTAATADAQVAGAKIGPEGLLQLGMGFWGSKALLSAVELGVFTALAQGSLTAEELAHHVGVHPRGARDFFDALVALGQLRRHDGQYGNTPETDLFLDRAKPSYVGGLLEMMNSRLYAAWGHLTEALRTGKCENKIDEGHSTFDTLYADQAGLESFLKAMTGISTNLAGVLAAQFPWDQYESFADLGCAQGGATVRLAQVHPHLRAVGFDLPPVGPVFEAYVAEQGVTDRVSWQGGNLFTDTLPATQVYVMGHILHGVDLSQKRDLVRRAFEALPPGGALLVYDAMIDNDRSHNAFGLLMSLNMLLETPGGFDYTQRECLGWLDEAGFERTRVEPLFGPHSLAFGFKP